MVHKALLVIGVLAAVFAVLVFSGKLPIGKNNADKPKGEVILWGTFPEEQMNTIIQEFNPKAQTYRVVYKEVRADAFNQTLVEALANGAGPDMVLAPHQILLSQASRLYPFPVTSFSEKSYKDAYVDGASLFFSPYGAIALPISIEPLVLFYNRTLLSKHGVVNPPKYWDEVLSMTPQLTVQNNQGQFLESAIAFGAANTPYAKDILMAIVSQLGQIPVLVQYNQQGGMVPTVLADRPLIEGGEIRPLSTAVRFFTQFADPTKSSYTWSTSLGNASDRFVSEKLAMYIGYSGELSTLRAQNPKAEFEMTFLPQTRDQNTFATGARMYGIATLRSTRNLVASLTVQSQFAGVEYSPRIASIVGGSPAMRSYVSTAGLNDVISRSLLVARGWYDSFPVQSATLVASMLSDIVNNRYGVTDATGIFVSRLQDMYTPQ
jgi:ABC-type glycerol-3-phosphate transport system substrate-binding protein